MRLLIRAINRLGHEGPAELGKVETLLAQLDRNTMASPQNRVAQTAVVRVKRTLAGAVVSFEAGQIRIEPAPHRRTPSRLKL